MPVSGLCGPVYGNLCFSDLLVGLLYMGLCQCVRLQNPSRFFLLLLIHRQNVFVFVSFLSMSGVILELHTLYIVNLLLFYSVLILTHCLMPGVIVVGGGYTNRLNK